MRLGNHKNGFTLIEVLIAVIFVGLAIAALMAGNGVFTQANAIASEMSTAEFLTEQVRERLTLLHFENLLAYNNITYNPPQDAKGAPLPAFAAYSQKITIEYVENNNFTQVDTTPDSTNRFIRVTVKINLGTKELSSTSWVRAQIIQP